MKIWYHDVKKDITALPEALEYYQKELNDARNSLKSTKSNIIQLASQAPADFELRFCQLQDCEAILEYLNIQLRNLRSSVFRSWFENQKNSRVLGVKECERYVDCDQSVLEMSLLVNDVALTRNQFLGILKALDARNYQINNVVKLRVAGLEDATL